MSTKNIMEISSKKVIDFFNTHQTLDINVMNELMVDILNNIISTMSNQINTTTISNILTTITDTSNKQDMQIKQSELYYNTMTKYIDGVKSDIVYITDMISKLSNEITTVISLKLLEYKQSYITEIKEILNNNEKDVYNNLIPLLDKTTNTLVDKTSVIISNYMNDTGNVYYKQIETTLSSFQNAMKLENYKLINDIQQGNKNITPEQIVSQLVTSLDTKFTELSLSIQSPITQYINTTEDRLSNKITSMSELTSNINTKQTKLTEEMNEFLNKFRTGANKGSFGEGLLFNILNVLYPTAEVIDATTDASNRTDFILKRSDKAMIFIENKDYNRNIPPEEINKFIRDTNKHKAHGIFLSQKSGITNKPNWYVEIYNKKVRIYVHNVQYNNDIIKMAIDIVDTLAFHIESETAEQSESDYSLPEETLSMINEEIRNFIEKKLEIINIIKDHEKILITSIDNLNPSPTLLSILDSKYSSISQIDPLLCPYCKMVRGKNHASLSAHKRGCKKRNTTIDIEREQILSEDKESVDTDEFSQDIKQDATELEINITKKTKGRKKKD